VCRVQQLYACGCESSERWCLREPSGDVWCARHLGVLFGGKEGRVEAFFMGCRLQAYRRTKEGRTGCQPQCTSVMCLRSKCDVHQDWGTVRGCEGERKQPETSIAPLPPHSPPSPPCSFVRSRYIHNFQKKEQRKCLWRCVSEHAPPLTTSSNICSRSVLCPLPIRMGSTYRETTTSHLTKA
jgi:hypothetical protein